MKVTYEFEGYDDQDDLIIFQQAKACYFVLLEMDDYLRSKLKYTQLTDEEYAIYEKIRSKLTELKLDNNVRMDL